MPYSGEVLSGLYQIVDEIGKGGAGIIYRAYHLNLHKYVVVKKIKDNFVGVLNARGEVDILKSLHHTCLPQVYDFIQIGNDIYTVMDYIEGHDLKYYIDNGYSFNEETLWMWLNQLMDVLNYLHRHGILHMDIKPANIMLTQEGNICLIDFNISLADSGEDIMGISEAYASPEQYRKFCGTMYGTPDKNIVLDEATDIYSIGATFYHMMTRYRPSQDFTKMPPITQFKLPYSDVLVRMIDKMLKVDKKARFQSADGVLRSIRHQQRSKAEKNTLKAVFGVMLVAVVVLVVVCVIAIFRGQAYVGRDDIANIQAMEARMIEMCDGGEYLAAYQEGVNFLNAESENLAKLEGARQGIVEVLVEACIGMKDYNTASYYLDELLAIEGKKEYYQNLAIIAAYRGDYSGAEEALQMAESAGGSSLEIKRSRAEMKVAQGLYGEALTLFQEVYMENPEAILLRRMAAVSLSAAQVEAISGSRSLYSTYLNNAVTYYEQLVNGGLSSYSDKMNLATAYVMTGLEEKALLIYEGMSTEYTDRYEVFLQLAILEYNVEMKKHVASRDLTKAKEHALTAKQLLNQTQNGKTDEQLENLLEILE